MNWHKVKRVCSVINGLSETLLKTAIMFHPLLLPIFIPVTFLSILADKKLNHENHKNTVRE